MDKLTFTMVSYDEMKKSDKRGYSTLYLYWLENGKINAFDLPLFVSDDGKGVLSFDVFKRVFWAFQCKIGFNCVASIVSGDDGNDSKYNVVHIVVTNEVFNRSEVTCKDYTEPKKADVKRESSKKTAEKSKAKKETAEEQAKKETEELFNQFNKKASMKIADHIQGKYKLKCDRTLLENEIMTILASIQ